MQADFFNPQNYHKLIQRFTPLQENSKPKWGIMSSTQMLKHLQLENDLALGNYRGKDYSNFFREWAFKMVISGKIPLPTVFSKMRMIPAIAELDVVKSKVQVDNFDSEKEKLLLQFNLLFHCKDLSSLHPAIGK